MLRDFEDMEFPWNSFDICYILDFIFLENFDGYRLACFAMDS